MNQEQNVFRQEPCSRGIREAYRRHPAATQKAPRRHPARPRRAPGDTQNPQGSRVHFEARSLENALPLSPMECQKFLESLISQPDFEGNINSDRILTIENASQWRNHPKAFYQHRENPYSKMLEQKSCSSWEDLTKPYTCHNKTENDKEQCVCHNI